MEIPETRLNKRLTGSPGEVGPVCLKTRKEVIWACFHAKAQVKHDLDIHKTWKLDEHNCIVKAEKAVFLPILFTQRAVFALSRLLHLQIKHRRNVLRTFLARSNTVKDTKIPGMNPEI